MKIIITIITILISLPSFAQDSRLDAIFNKFRDSKNFKVEFYNGDSDFILISKGDNFKVENINADIIYNGKELYTINKNVKEVIIEELAGDGILANPIRIFTLDTSSFNIEQIASSYILTPLDVENVGAESITLTLNSKNELEKLSITPLSSESITFNIYKVYHNITLTETFKFNKNDYPEFEIIDFR